MQTNVVKLLLVALVYSRLYALASPTRVTLNIEHDADHNHFMVTKSCYKGLPYTVYRPLPGYDVHTVSKREGPIWIRSIRRIKFLAAFVYYTNIHNKYPFFCIQVRLANGVLVSLKDKSGPMEELKFSLVPFLRSAMLEQKKETKAKRAETVSEDLDYTFLSDILEHISREEARKWNVGTLAPARQDEGGDNESHVNYSDMEDLENDGVEEIEDDPMEGTSSGTWAQMMGRGNV
ncbi:signal peptide containing protein [Theileria equi strain WA]|uniref:Signal peptide containing protein n=1 Tax=Theileria equi strain WA TaxID=1537102 RepID=L1LE22_THEEQ|nr:signal peptide containing protein [Theileria equi strain WA]EKX73403.1 signal peptide containing protein [Theileria equi strain WA]|eukprot:XP_004832855.1 signal peptide containing protein [Theileria equi strain WA]